MSKYAFAAAAALSALIASSAAMAELGANQFTVSVNVVAGCTVNAAGTVFFGGEALNSARNGTGVGIGVSGAELSAKVVDKDILVTCTKDTGYGLTMSSGNSANPFNMVGSTGNTDKIPYSVKFKSSGAADKALTSQEFPTTANTLTGLGAKDSFKGTGSQQTVKVTLTIGTVTTLPKVDTYSDVVTVGVNF